MTPWRQDWVSFAKHFGFDPARGLTLKQASEAWQDFEDDYQGLLQLTKLEFMFSW
jgi:hypothetical protein